MRERLNEVFLMVSVVLIMVAGVAGMAALLYVVLTFFAGILAR